MKKIILSVTFVLITMISFAQNQANNNESNFQRKPNCEVIYQLFPTQNMWTFIKLNTRNGKMWQVQYDIKGNERFETYLNFSPLVTKEKEENGRFTLYPTQNMWTFILLDQIDGKMWQVQWAMKANERFVVPIE
jgi:hypothetical protein